MAGQARGLEQTYYSGTKMDNYRDRFMSPQAQALISKYYPSKVGEQPASGGTNGTAKSSAATHRYNPATGKVEAIQ